MAHHHSHGHGAHCPSTTISKYMNGQINVTAPQAALLTAGVALAKGLLGTLITGKMDFSELGREAADITAQAIEHPNVYHPPRHR